MTVPGAGRFFKLERPWDTNLARSAPSSRIFEVVGYLYLYLYLYSYLYPYFCLHLYLYLYLYLVSQVSHSLTLAQARSGVYIIHCDYYHSEDIEDAVKGALGVEGIPHYVVYNAETRVLFTYPEVRPTTTTSTTTTSTTTTTTSTATTNYHYHHCFDSGARVGLRGAHEPCRGVQGAVESPNLSHLLGAQGRNVCAPGGDQVHG